MTGAKYDKPKITFDQRSDDKLYAEYGYTAPKPIGTYSLVGRLGIGIFPFGSAVIGSWKSIRILTRVIFICNFYPN